MMTVTKCDIVKGNRSDIKSGMKVYLYKKEEKKDDKEKDKKKEKE